MAEEEITKVYNVEIKATEALKEVAALTLQSKELREEQKKLDTSTEEGRLQYAKYGEQIKAINARVRERQKEIQNTIKSQNAEKASLEALRTQLSLDTAALAKLGDTEANAAKRDALQQRIKATSDELKRQEEAYGDHRRSVGDYEKATRNLGAELGELIQKLAILRAEGKDQSAEYQEMSEKATALKNAVDTVNKEIAAGSANTATINALSQAVSGVVGVFGAWQSVTALVGDENEDLVETIKKLQVASTALASITAIQNSLLKESIVYQKSANIVRALGINQEARAAKAQALALVLKKQDIGVTKLVTAAQWLWNAALAANPVMLIVTGIGFLVGGVILLTNAFDKNAKSAKAAAEAQKEYESSVERTNAELERIERRRTIQQNKAKVNAEEEITLMRENGYTAEEIAKRRAKAEQESTDIEVRAAQDRINANVKERSEAETNLKIQQKVLFGMSEKHKKYKEQKQIVDDLTKSIRDLDKEISADQTLVQMAAIEARNKQLNEQEEAEKKAFDLAVKFSERRQSLQEAAIKAESDYQKEDYATKVAYESRLQLLQLNGEKERLAIQLRYKKITTTEYAAQIKILEDNYRAFQNTQIKNMNEYFKSVRDSLFDMAGKTVDEQIADITKKYEKAFKDLENGAKVAPVRIEGMSDAEFDKLLAEWDDFMLAQGQLRLRLEKAQEKEIADVRYNARQKSINDIDTLIDREYADDLAKFSDNEREKLRIEAESLQKRIEEREKAGLETGDLEAELRQNQTATAQLDLNADLLTAQNNAEAKYEARKAYLLKEQEIYANNADRQMQINAELAANEKELFDERLANIEQWASASQQIVGALNDFFSAIGERQMQKAQEEADNQKAILDDKLKNNLISQEEYDKQIEKIDADLAKKQAKIERENAIRERIVKAFSVITDTATGIMKAVSTFWITGGQPWASIIAGIGAAQLATIMAAPLPKAAKGKFIDGPSHSGGGVPIEAEGGEVIINKKSASAFLPLLSAINEAGGGVPFVRPLSDGGFAARYAVSGGGLSRGEMAEAIHDGIKDLKIFTAVEDIRRENEKYVNVENRANF
jgi:hypothetical protein